MVLVMIALLGLAGVLSTVNIFILFQYGYNMENKNKRGKKVIKR